MVIGLFQLAGFASIGFGLGTILYGRLKRAQKTWPEIAVSIFDSTLHFFFFAGYIAFLHSAFK